MSLSKTGRVTESQLHCDITRVTHCIRVRVLITNITRVLRGRPGTQAIFGQRETRRDVHGQRSGDTSGDCATVLRPHGARCTGHAKDLTARGPRDLTDGGTLRDRTLHRAGY